MGSGVKTSQVEGAWGVVLKSSPDIGPRSGDLLYVCQGRVIQSRTGKNRMDRVKKEWPWTGRNYGLSVLSYNLGVESLNVTDVL